MGPEWMAKEYCKDKFDVNVDWTQFLDSVWGEQKEAWDSLKGTGKEALKTGLKPRRDI